MSGGSFDYLYTRDVEELVTYRVMEDLRRMADTLSTEEAHEAAAETEDLIAYITHARRQIEARQKRLSEVWHAMEWWKSADWSKEQFLETLKEYRSK